MKPTIHTEPDAGLDDRPDWALRALVAAVAFLKPQVEIIRRRPLPEESELHPHAPDYRDILPRRN